MLKYLHTCCVPSYPHHVNALLFYLQIVSMGVDFNCKMDIWLAYLCCVSSILISLFLSASTYLTFKFEYSQYDDGSKSILLSTTSSIGFLIPASPGIAFIFLLHNLHKRFTTLNSFLRLLKIFGFRFFFIRLKFTWILNYFDIEIDFSTEVH